jgi:single stranded DNA-binding protein (ssb)
MNRVCLVGRLTKDPVCEYVNTSNGSIARSRFTIAVDRGFSGNETNGPTADFISITSWRKQAENITKFQKKGNQIAVEGRLQVDNYTNKDGQQVWSTYVVADTIKFLDRKGSTGDMNDNFGNSNDNNNYNDVTPSDFAPSSSSAPATGVWDAGSNIEIDEDELPFY